MKERYVFGAGPWTGMEEALYLAVRVACGNVALVPVVPAPVIMPSRLRTICALSNAPNNVPWIPHTGGLAEVCLSSKIKGEIYYAVSFVVPLSHRSSCDRQETRWFVLT